MKTMKVPGLIMDAVEPDFLSKSVPNVLLVGIAIE